MRRALDEGLSAAEAARAALERGQPSEGLLEDAAARLLAAIGRYDETAGHAVLDETLGAFGLEAVLREVILSTLRQVGLGWEQGTLEISQEHFASNLIRGRLLSLARLWSRGGGPLALTRVPTRRDTRHQPACLRPAPTLARLADPLPRRRHTNLDTDPNRQNNPTRARGPHQLQPSTAPSAEDRTAPPRQDRPTRPQRPRRIRHALHPARRTTPRRRPHRSRQPHRTHNQRLNSRCGMCAVSVAFVARQVPSGRQVRPGRLKRTAQPEGGAAVLDLLGAAASAAPNAVSAAGQQQDYEGDD